MATKGRRKPSDSEILSMLSDGIAAGVKFTDTKLSKERQKVMDYYNGVLPAPVHGGNSKYVSTDVFDAVESMKATLVETFSAHSDIVAFTADGPEDVEEAEVATRYTKHVIYELNAGTALFTSVIHDGLTSRNAIVKVYWDERIEPLEETFEDLDDNALMVLLSEDGVEPGKLEFDEETSLYSGTVARKENRSQVRIEVLPSEEFIVNPNIKSLDDAPQISHRMERSKSDLLKEGYPADKVEQLSRSDSPLDMDPERVTRFSTISDGIGRSQDYAQEASKLFIVYETYAELDLDGSGVARMWRIVHSGEVILEKEQVDRHPFRSFAPLPIPHSFFGGNFATKAIPIQNAKTVLTRSILDHAVVANNPRYGVVKGALTNPRELIDNRIGGLVNVSRPDGIFPLPQAPLNPFVFQTIEMLDSDKEDATGVSRLSQGLNKDAISSQNSEGMVEKLIGASMQRQKTIARAFAYFLAELYIEVYRLVVENEDQERIVEVAGAYKPVDPKAWARQRNVSIDFRLGYGERDQLAREFLEMGQLLANDPGVQHLYGPEERRNVYRRAFEAKGHKNILEFLKDPASTEPPQPDPKLMAEVKQIEANIAQGERKLALAEQEAQATIGIEQLKADMDQRFKAMEFMLKNRDADRKDAETQNRIEVSQVEMDLAVAAQAEAPEANQKASAIISPNG